MSSLGEDLEADGRRNLFFESSLTASENSVCPCSELVIQCSHL